MTTKRSLPPTPEHDDNQQTKRLKLAPTSTPNTNTQHQYDVPVTTESFNQTTTTDQQYPSDIDLPASLNSIKEFIIHKEQHQLYTTNVHDPHQKEETRALSRARIRRNNN